MNIEYVRKKDVEALIKAYFKTKIEEGEMQLDPVDACAEILEMLDDKAKVYLPTLPAEVKK